MTGPAIFSTKVAALLSAGLLLHGCDAVRARRASPPAPQAPVVTPQVPEWQRTALADDIDRIGRMNQAWEEALTAARNGGARRGLAAERELLEPGAALPRPAPGPGSYMCRLVQIGPTARRARVLSSSRPEFCYVGVDDQDRLWLARQTGPLRREGYLWQDGNPRRLIYLGTLATGGKDAAPSYGTVPDRSRGAVFERVGPLRYRLVTPWPPGYKLEVMELTPAPVQSED